MNWEPPPQEEILEVWPENWETWMAFLGLSSPWRYLSGLSAAAIVGLDATEVLAGLKLQGIKKKRWPKIFAGLKIIADTAIPILNAP